MSLPEGIALSRPSLQRLGLEHIVRGQGFFTLKSDGLESHAPLKRTGQQGQWRTAARGSIPIENKTDSVPERLPTDQGV
jgi:hypothetical protein